MAVAAEVGWPGDLPPSKIARGPAVHFSPTVTPPTAVTILHLDHLYVPIAPCSKIIPRLMLNGCLRMGIFTITVKCFVE